MVRSLQLMGQTVGVQLFSVGSSWNRETTLLRSMGRSNVTLIGASPGTLPSPLCGETSSIAGAEGEQAARPIAVMPKSTNRMGTNRIEAWAPGLEIGLNPRATLSES